MGWGIIRKTFLRGGVKYRKISSSFFFGGSSILTSIVQSLELIGILWSNVTTPPPPPPQFSKREQLPRLTRNWAERYRVHLLNQAVIVLIRWKRIIVWTASNPLKDFSGSLRVIDVSQSVDLDHPLASYFLCLDCKHVSDFFRKNGVKVLSTRELFDFIVDSSITDESVHSYLEEVQREILVWRDAMSRLISVEVNNLASSSFSKLRRNSKTLQLLSGDTVGLLYLSPAPKQLLKLPEKSGTNDTSTGQTNNFGTESGTDEDKEENNDDDDSSDSEGLEPYDTRKEGTREAVIPADKKAARKENKKKVKEEKREARKTKTPKAERKKKKKLSKNIKAR
ncbi:serine/threonine-protein kinase rio1-like [Papaver somniferum]|uniref:serine/threonine-protein kinase rio1-like n=1 Tax=Papaver somniferum TaxID=3469 RepID=UPI000E701DA8|nr:serine/threonine-protein kinase rio1-like [Papaver somniferum]